MFNIVLAETTVSCQRQNKYNCSVTVYCIRYECLDKYVIYSYTNAGYVATVILILRYLP